MGKTYRHSSDGDNRGKKPKHYHNNKQSNGMKIVNYYEDEDDFFDDDVDIEDHIVINKTREES